MTEGVDETIRALQAQERGHPRRRLPGPRGRPVAADHRRRAPRGSRRADHRPLGRLAERVPPAGVRGGRGRHGDVPADEGAAPVRDEQGDRPPTRPGRRGRRAARGTSSSASSGRRAGPARRSRRPTSPSRSRSPARRCMVIDLDLQFGDVALCLGLPPEKTIYDLAVSGGSLDEDKLADYVMTHQTRGSTSSSRPRGPTRRARSRSSCFATSWSSPASTTTSSSPTRRRASPPR